MTAVVFRKNVYKTFTAPLQAIDYQLRFIAGKTILISYSAKYKRDIHHGCPFSFVTCKYKKARIFRAFTNLN